MSDQRPTQALDRLSQFEAAAPQPPPRQVRGRPGAQMAMSIVLPGTASMRRSPLIGLLVFVAGVATPIVFAAWAFRRRDDLIGVALESRFLTLVTALGLALVLSRLLAVAEVAHAFRDRRGISWRTGLATLVVVTLAVPVLLYTFRANEARSAVASVFGGGGPSLFVPTEEEPGVDPEAVTNVLLLGGDAGPGRWGMRTDTMILVSIHEASGRTALVSIPRNLRGLQWPPGTPLATRFPDGFDAYDGLTNAVFTYVTGDDMLMGYYGTDGRQGEAVALAEGIGYSLDVEIDSYALVNMQGFTQIIDAVGGVTIDLADVVPLPPSIPGERPLPLSVGPGPVEMDGAMAIAFVRSRQGDSDYQRMERQRQLLAALGSQVSPGDALAGFGEVTGALDDSMRTSMSSSDFSSLLDRLGDSSSIGESIGLIPPLVEPGRPDWAQVHTIIDAVQTYVRTGTPSGFA
jgi:polyisoprenyl-teichoic acid--peptidoglycan teichoic acid transferase